MIEYGFGIVGLGVMGRNFLLNVSKSGRPALGYDLDPGKVDRLLSEGGGSDVAGTASIREFFQRLSTPRSIMLFVPADLVDQAIEDCIPFLDKGDLLIDGGNSHFPDTERRAKLVESVGASFLGIGVSGGEEGARNGACMMAGGNETAFQMVAEVLGRAAAKVGQDPCLALVGKGSSGHFVKMVHNGIEYGMMQILCEAYDFMQKILAMEASEMSEVFAKWNSGRLNSFLVEITAKILRKTDAETGRPLVDLILDAAGQKGTGRWSSQAAMDFGVPVPTIDAAVAMRQISALKEQRESISTVIDSPRDSADVEKQQALADLEQSVFGAFVSVYAQGFSLIAAASDEKGYGVNQSEIAKIWRGGCIIRSSMLESIREAFGTDPHLANLLLDDKFSATVSGVLTAWRSVVSAFVASGIPSMGLASALAYVEAMSSERLPANLLQAQRDLFGAHSYKRTDREGDFHTEDWQ